MKVVAVVPARGGSKGFPDKNIAKIEGKTLLEWAVEVGLRSRKVQDVYVSTDSPQYEAIAIRAGAKSVGLRPATLATDTAKTVDVIIDLVAKLPEQYDVVVVLQPTSPLRSPRDIDNVVTLLEKSKAEAVVSLVRLGEPHPHKLKIISDGVVQPFLPGTSSEVPRQQLPEVYRLNGAIYAIRTNALWRHRTLLPPATVPYLMDPHLAINIDSVQDWMFLECMVRHGQISVSTIIEGNE